MPTDRPDKEDFALLISTADEPANTPESTETPPEPAAPPETTPAATEANPADSQTAAETPADAETETPAAEVAPVEKPKGIDKALQKFQQRQTQLEQTIAGMEALLRKVATVNGVDTEPAPAEQPDMVPANGPPTANNQINAALREVEFLKIRIANPGADPDDAWKTAWDKAFEMFGVEDNEPLPEGITPQSLSVVANKYFNSWVDGLKKAPTPKPQPVPAKGTPPRRLPPKTPGGAGVGQRPPASPVPQPRTSARDDLRNDCKELMGLD